MGPLGGAEARHRAVRRVLLITLAANVLVVVAKALVGILTGTLSVTAEAAHSSVDAFNNVLALSLARLAAEAPDERHPYGHAKFETLGAFAVVAFLSVTVFELVTGAARRLLSGTHDPRVTPLVFIVMGAAAVVSLAVSWYEERRGRELHSALLRADAVHTRTDVYASGAVLVGLVVVVAGYPQADAIVTLLVAAVIARAGWIILRTTLPVLLDERAVEAQAIRRVALATDGVRGCYDVRSRGRAGDAFAELTVAVDPRLDVRAGHAIADRVEQRVAAEVGALVVVVHVEPAGERPG
ncbi:MAG TPA: cation diffusion facilitator family transporter [Longimicrobiales bacterium]|nr:cation diffusion facilitator family transporter [Longimicrobiales bacterium]